MKLWRYLDFSAVQPGLYINDHKKFYTVTGAILNFFAFAAILGISILFTVNYFEKNQAVVINGQLTEYDRMTNFSEIPFMFRAEKTGVGPYDPSIGYFVVQKLTFESIGPPKVELLKTERCDLGRHFGNYSSIFEPFGVQDFLCLSDFEGKNTVQGKRGDKSGFSSITLFYTKCSNASQLNSDPGKCADEDEIEKELAILPLLKIATVDFVLDHSAKGDPFIPSLAFKQFTMSNSLFSYVNFLFFKQSFYSSDDGWVFEDIKKYSHANTDTVTTDILHDASHPFPGTVGILNIFNSEKADTFRRSYVKLQVLIANIGGVVKSILLIAMILNYTISEHLLKLHLMNTVIDNNEMPKSSGKSNPLSPFNSSNMLINNYQKVNEMITQDKNNLDHINNKTKTEFVTNLSRSRRNSKFKLSVYQILFSCCINHNKNKKLTEFNRRIDLTLKIFSMENFASLSRNMDYIKHVLFTHDQNYLLSNLPNKTVNKLLEDQNELSYSETKMKEVYIKLDSSSGDKTSKEIIKLTDSLLNLK